MKRMMLFLVVSIGSSGFGQTEELSPRAKQLKCEVDAGNYAAILSASKSGDRTIIPYLKQLTMDENGKSNSNSPAFNAHVSLAKLGEKDALTQILLEVDGQYPRVQDLKEEWGHKEEWGQRRMGPKEEWGQRRMGPSMKLKPKSSARLPAHCLVCLAVGRSC
jgi:hypothetical protein